MPGVRSRILNFKVDVYLFNRIKALKEVQPELPATIKRMADYVMQVVSR